MGQLLQKYSGLNNVAEYMASGMPWLKSISLNGTEEIEFPYVTIAITIKASSDVKLGFSSIGIAGDNYFTIPAGEIFKANVRVAKIFLEGSGNVEVFAELTGIQSRFYPDIEEMPGVGD